MTVWYGFVLAATLAFLGVIVWATTAASMRDALSESLQVQAADVRAGIENGGTDAITMLDPARPGIFTVIFGRETLIGLHSPGVPLGLTRPALGSSSVRLSPAGPTYLLLAEPAPGDREIVVGRSLEELEASLDALKVRLLGLGVVGAMASMALGWWLSGRALLPVARLTREADSLRAADIDRRLPEPASDSDDEIGALTMTLNRMLDRVSDAVRRERAFIAGASHDLRTPISALQTELELAQRTPDDREALLEAIRDAHGDAIRLGNLASDLLDLAEAEANGRQVLRRPVAADELIGGAVVRVQPLADERSVKIAVAPVADTVEVDRVRIEQVLVNLLANAIRAAPIESTVDVVGQIESDGRAAARAEATGRRTFRVAVMDRGGGVPREVRRLLFVPFAARTGPQSGGSGGSGLGLATAAAGVRAHGGQIGYEDRRGGGAVFWFSLPVTHPRLVA